MRSNKALERQYDSYVSLDKVVTVSLERRTPSHELRHADAFLLLDQIAIRAIFNYISFVASAGCSGWCGSRRRNGRCHYDICRVRIFGGMRIIR